MRESVHKNDFIRVKQPFDIINGYVIIWICIIVFLQKLVIISEKFDIVYPNSV